MTAFRLDGSYRRHDRVVVAGSPLRLFRLSANGVKVAEALERGDPLPAGHAKLTTRLVEAGAIHPAPTGSPFTADDVTIVVPAHNAHPSQTPRGSRVIVVDDGSVPPLTVVAGQQAIRLPTNRGPAAARNAGLESVSTALVAFVDTDVDLGEGWLDALLPHFDDPQVALVAPRVASRRGSTTLAHYEAVRSPLDLGTEPARIAAGTRVSYVPGAALVARRDAVRAIGGFDESLRVGEDVDMVWRLIAAGHRCRYEPASTVHHRPRATLQAWVRQRAAYGRSAAALASRHPRAVPPLRMSGWSAAVWALVHLRRPGAAAMVAVGTTVALRRKLGDLPASESVRLAGLGHLYAGRQVAGAITRVWWPLALVVAVLAKRTRLPLLASAAVPAVLDWVGDGKPLDLVRYSALHLADDAAYGTGAWIGAIERHEAGALRPNFTNWPGRATG